MSKNVSERSSGVLYGPDQRLRHGWWALVFVVVIVACGLLQAGLLKGLKAAGLPGGRWQLGVGLLMVVAGTWVCTRLRGDTLASVGLDLDRRWARTFALGTALGASQILVAALMSWSVGGFHLALDPARSVMALGAGLLMFTAVSLIEEILFRGFLFQRLRDAIGTWPTQVLLAVAFAVAHWSNPGMEGSVKVWATVDTALGAIVLGLAYLRTGSLALPVGMHLGWNWMQGSVLGFGVSGTKDHGWFQPVLLDQPMWTTGGAFGLEASAFAVIVDAAALLLLLSWRGVTPAPTTSVPVGTTPLTEARA